MPRSATTQYATYLAERCRVDPLVIDWGGCFVSYREEMIPAKLFPGGGFAYAVEPGERYRKQVITSFRHPLLLCCSCEPQDCPRKAERT